MTYQQACKLSTVGIAVLYREDAVAFWTWDPEAQKAAVPKMPDRAVCPRGARLVDHRYAGLQNDWTPWMGKDVVTMLGDLVREREERAWLSVA